MRSAPMFFPFEGQPSFGLLNTLQLIRKARTVTKRNILLKKIMTKNNIDNR